MADVRRVTDRFSVAPQLRPEEMAEVAAAGFRRVVNNRPDGEAAGQPTSAEMEAAARAAGLDYLHIPVAGPTGPAEAAAMHAASDGVDGPVLAFCRSGTRSITLWARGEATAGTRTREDLVRLGRDAGYDLSASL